MGDDMHSDKRSARRRVLAGRGAPPAAVIAGCAGIPGGLRPTLILSRPSPGHARRAGLLAVVTGTLLAACGCSAGTPAGKPARTASATAGSLTPSASPAGPAQSAARLALAAYTGMWQEMQAAGVTADWKDPRLASYASGQALGTLVTGLRNARDKGIVVKGTIVTHPRAGSVTPAASPDRVMVTDCLDDAHWLNYGAATGKLQNNVPGGHRLVEAVVTKSAGQWAVSRLAVHAEGTC